MPEDDADTDSEWPGLLICASCQAYVEADKGAEATSCDHTWDEARDISDLDGEQWVKIRHDAYVRELHRDEPRVERAILTSNMASLMFDLTMADALPEDYDDRDGLDKLLEPAGGPDGE